MNKKLMLFTLMVVTFSSTIHRSFAQCAAGDCPNGITTINSGNAGTAVTVSSGQTKCIVVTENNLTLSGLLRINDNGTLKICTTDPTFVVNIPDGGIDYAGAGGKMWSDGAIYECRLVINCTINYAENFISDDAAITINSGGTYNNTYPDATVASNFQGKLVNYGTYNFVGTSTTDNLNFSGGSRVENYGTFNTNRSMYIADDFINYTDGVINANITLGLQAGAYLINDGEINVKHDFLAVASTFFDNNGDWTVGRNSQFSGSYNQNSSFTTGGTLTLNASGSFSIESGIFFTDSLILNAGTLDAGLTCAVFWINKYSSIQNGSGITGTPAGSVGIIDQNNLGQIDNVAAGCGGTDGDLLDNASTPPATPNTGTYCGIRALSSLASAGSGSCFMTLPVVWKSFTGASISEHVNELKWTVANSDDLLYFEAEVSSDGQVFEPLVRKYKYSDESVLDFSYKHFTINSTVLYYRIKEVSIKSERIHYSPVISVNTHQSNLLVAFPNPAENKITLMCNSIISQVTIYDMKGNVVLESNDGQSTDMNIENLNPGMYYIKANTENDVKGTIFIKK